ncbi:MAG: MAPEG family protein [Pseudomonadota bacterium]
MPAELTQILIAVVLVAGHFVPFAVIANRDLGTDYTTGPRDAPMTGLSNIGGRLQRAYQNYLESLPWFIAVMLVAHLTERADSFVIIAGWTYLAARIAYVPAYVSSTGYLRSAVWMVATGAIFAVAFRLLLF